jgi:hypothetical protein
MTQPREPIDRLVIVLPVKLPTWNDLLAAGPHKRAKIRHLIHELVLRSCLTDHASLMPMEYQRKPRLMGSLCAEYLRTIQRGRSTRSGIGKSRLKTYRTKKRKS